MPPCVRPRQWGNANSENALRADMAKRQQQVLSKDGLRGPDGQVAVREHPGLLGCGDPRRDWTSCSPIRWSPTSSRSARSAPAAARPCPWAMRTEIRHIYGGKGISGRHRRHAAWTIPTRCWAAADSRTARSSAALTPAMKTTRTRCPGHVRPWDVLRRYRGRDIGRSSATMRAAWPTTPRSMP